MDQPKPDKEMDAGASQIREAVAAKKCWSCGCLHSSLKAIEQALPPEKRPHVLSEAMSAAKDRLVPVKYDCLGCQVCYPAIAINALGIEGDNCPSEPVSSRDGWPPLPGAYQVLRYQAPVAVCTLTDESLAMNVAGQKDLEIGIVGTLQTENLGIERLITNLLANPNLRFLVLCGSDSRQAVGHLPGQSLVALAQQGLDERSYIIGAKGRRPSLKNLPRSAVDHFRATLETVDLIGTGDLTKIAGAIHDCASRSPGPAKAYETQKTILAITGYIPERMTSDPAGYFIVYVDRKRRLLSLEHYKNEGVLDRIIEGPSAAELYWPAIEKGCISRLDHAAYLGRELTRAEQALKSGAEYIQDAAPEHRFSLSPTCGCQGNSCNGQTA